MSGTLVGMPCAARKVANCVAPSRYVETVRGAAFDARRWRRKESIEGPMSPTIDATGSAGALASLVERLFPISENYAEFALCDKQI
jgi:hypothetical protein